MTQPPKPPKKLLPLKSTYQDKRKKDIDVGQQVAYVLSGKYNADGEPTIGIINSIQTFEDYNWDWKINRWVRYEKTEVRFEGTVCVRNLEHILKLEQ